MRVGRHPGLGSVDEVLRGGRTVALRGRGAEKLRRGLVPRTRSAAPRVVAVGRGDDDDRAVGVRGDVVDDLADALVGVAVAVGEDVIRGNGIHLFLRAGLRIDILDPVELVGERGDIPRGVARIGHAIPPLGGGVETRGELVGAVRRAGVNAVGTFGIGLVVVARAGAADMVARHQRPLVALVDQDVDQVSGVGHLGGEKSFRMVGQVGVAAPRFPPRLLEGLDLLAEDRLRQQRPERVVVGESQHVHARRTGGSLPTARLAVSGVPVALVTEVTAAAELTDVVDQRARVAHAEAGAVVDVGQGIPRPLLVGIFAVIETEDVREVVLRV